MKIKSHYLTAWKFFVKSLAVSTILSGLLLFSLALAETHTASVIPWSGYWWPFKYGGLATGRDYRGWPAPLEKYNLLTTGITAGSALDYYRSNYYDPGAPYWYGLCAFWARAACYEHVDFFPSSEENLVFRVGDKKGLLTLAHDKDLMEAGNGAYPEVFHFWLLNYLRDQRKAFVADLDPGEEVWSYPIYKYDMRTVKTGNVESVSVRVYYADDYVAPDYMGTRTDTSDYSYDLFLDADGAITGGQWTGISTAKHPDFLSFSFGIGAIFRGLDYQEIMRLARARDDFLEQGSRSVEIAPGTYNLILLDEDVYSFSASTGDAVSLRIEKQPGSSRDMAAVVTDAKGVEVRRAAVTNDSPLDLLFTAGASPYTIRLTQADYTSDPNIYLLSLDLEKSFNQSIPGVFKADEWSGFALTNPGTAAVDGVILTSRDGDGAPLQTLLGPLKLGPGEKRLFFFSDLPVRVTEIYKSDRLTLAADGPVVLLNLVGDGDRFLTTFVQGEARGSHLVVPDTAAPFTPGVSMVGGVWNETFEDAAVTLRLYSADGQLQQETVETIAARRWLSLIPGQYPFYSMPASGWIDVQAKGAQTLSGFQYLLNSSGAESLFALPLTGAAKKIVPHVSRPGYYITKVTLINPQDAENSFAIHPALAGGDSSADYNIVLAPREKRTLEIQDLFARQPGDPLHHSILEITGRYSLDGYYSYNLSGGQDNASYPLLDENDFKNVLHLPHYAGNRNAGLWWTGVVVCNPSKISEIVRIEPHDYDGRLMDDKVQTVDLNAGAYDVFEVQTRFGLESAADISFITFRAEREAGAIGGFYLYGNRRNRNILSGANM